MCSMLDATGRQSRLLTPSCCSNIPTLVAITTQTEETRKHAARCLVCGRWIPIADPAIRLQSYVNSKKIFVRFHADPSRCVTLDSFTPPVTVQHIKPAWAEYIMKRVSMQTMAEEARRLEAVAQGSEQAKTLLVFPFGAHQQPAPSGLTQGVTPEQRLRADQNKADAERRRSQAQSSSVQSGGPSVGAVPPVVPSGQPVQSVGTLRCASRSPSNLSLTVCWNIIGQVSAIFL